MSHSEPIHIPMVSTVRCKGEVRTDGHAPVKFSCDDGHLYYCKYRKRFHRADELDYLRYEMVATYLLKALEVPTPEVAFVEVSEDAYDPDLMPMNREHVIPGVVMFGSRYEAGTLLHDMNRMSGPETWALLANPEDLVRMALFDVWTANADRGRPLLDEQYNYNVLLARATEGCLRLVAFDHAFLFHGQDGHGRFWERDYWHPLVHNTLLGTPWFADVQQYLGAERVRSVIEGFVVRLRSLEATSIVEEVLEQADTHWKDTRVSAERIRSFLWDQERIDEMLTRITDKLRLTR